MSSQSAPFGVVVLGCALFAITAHAQTMVTLSSDITVDLAGTTYTDEDAVLDDQLGGVTPQSLGTLPANVDVTGYEELANGDKLFSLDTTADLGGGVTLHTSDVGRYDGVGYSIEFDGSAEGVPDGSRVDAVTVASSGDLLLSFDTTVDLGGGVVAADEDLVSFDGANFALVFDGSAQGLCEALDLDGASLDIDTGRIGVSLDGSGSVGGVDFDDEDILEFQPVGSSWSLQYDGSSVHASLGPADVNAVPEPGMLTQLGAGAAALAWMARRRSARVR